MTTTTPANNASPALAAAKTPSQLHAQVNPSEVGWQFVPRYYTFVNKNPGRLHCFYAKNSTFIHGNEGDDSAPCYGIAEIHNKILSLNYNNCKVFINSVDAQSSANNGIIIQVIGEISNNGEPWKKFVQTFFLAEQPNGYFVLNDIFRYLKEESVTEEEEEDVTEADLPATVEVPAVEVPEPEQAAPIIEAAEEIPQEAPAPAVEPSPELPAAEPVKANGINGHGQPEPEAISPPAVEESLAVEEAPVEAAREPSPAPDALTPSAPSPVPSASARAAAPPSPAPAPVPAAAPAPPAQPPAPAVPAGPKTWASLAATDNKKWGSRMAQEAKGVSTTVAPSPPPAQTQQPPKAAPVGNGPASQHPAAQAAFSVSTAQCFVKGVTENIPENALRDVLTTRFGPIKELEIVRSKACAFLEFTTVEAARKAILTSLPQNQGGEGGIRIDGKHHTGTGLPPRITVETKKERGDRPAPKPRPNAPQQGGHQGGHQHANGTDGRGRGGRGGYHRGGRGGAGQK